MIDPQSKLAGCVNQVNQWALGLFASSCASDCDCVQTCFLISSTVPKWVHHAVKPVVRALEKYIPQPYAGEIRGLASHFGDSLSDVIILNFAYEISAYVSPLILPGPCVQWKHITGTISMDS